MGTTAGYPGQNGCCTSGGTGCVPELPPLDSRMLRHDNGMQRMEVMQSQDLKNDRVNSWKRRQEDHMERSWRCVAATMPNGCGGDKVSGWGPDPVAQSMGNVIIEDPDSKRSTAILVTDEDDVDDALEGLHVREGGGLHDMLHRDQGIEGPEPDKLVIVHRTVAF
mmetsp:Transcript_14470/g.31752  ORF Transcript_14470/g.31752 Transcript_14470/m.31752 type:complete len:165 (+) Transcript_14470:33-527(+)